MLNPGGRSGSLTSGQIFFFWLPLASTWIMMALEVPVLSALMARMDEPRYNLAAFGVAFAARVVVEAPVVMLMAAAVRLVRNRQTYRRLRRFAFLMTTGVTINFLILQIPGFFELWTIGWLNLDPELARLSGDTMLAVTVFPAAIGYRRFYQGILILENRGKEVAGGTLQIGRLSLVPESHVCKVDDQSVTLTSTEITILGKLMSRPKQVFSRPALVDAIWGPGMVVSDRTLDSHLRNLRSKLADAGCPDAIETLHGVGLRMGPCLGT